MPMATPEIPVELVGKWIAYTRDRSQIVGSGESFDQAKNAAAQRGCREVVIVKSAPATRWLHHTHVLCAVAVFISQAADALADLGDILP